MRRGKSVSTWIDRQGEYVNLQVTKYGHLLVELTQEGTNFVKEHEGYMPLEELFEDHFGNGWDAVPPESVGALTSAPIIGHDLQWNEDMTVVIAGEHIWWYPQYETKDPVEQLLNYGSIVMQRAK